MRWRREQAEPARRLGQIGARLAFPLLASGLVGLVCILLKPFIPRSAEAVYTSFNFPTPWADVKYADAAELKPQPDDLRVTAVLVGDKVKPLFPRIG